MAKLTNTIINGSERIKGILYADDIQGTVTKVNAVAGSSKIYLLGSSVLSGSAVPYLYSGLYYENGILTSPKLSGELSGANITDATVTSAKLTDDILIRGTLGATGLTSLAGLDVANDAVIHGNLTVSGTTTTVSSSNLTISDQLLELGKRDSTSAITGFTGLFVRNYDGTNSGFLGFDSQGWGYIGDVTVSGDAITNHDKLQYLATIDIGNSGIYKYDTSSHNFVIAVDGTDYVSNSVLTDRLASYETISALTDTLTYYVKKSDDITSQITASLGYVPVSPTSLSNTLSSYLTISAASSTYYTKTVLDSKEAALYSTITSTAAGIYSFKGSVATYADLPTDASTGDVYAIQTADSTKSIVAGDMLSYTGSQWENKGASYRYVIASSSLYGGVKTGYSTSNANRKYGLLLDGSGKAYVNVPWLDHPTYARSDADPVASAPGYGGTFPVISSVTTDNGHVTSVGTTNITMPSETHWTHKLKIGSQTFTWDANAQTKTLDTSVFMSDLGIGSGDLEFKGVTATLPETAEVGFMYKASSAFSIPKASSAENALTAVKAGDTIIAADSTPTWYVVPSGDDIEDTWRAIKVKGTQTLDSSITGNSVDFTEAANAPITLSDEGNGAISFGLKSIRTAGTYGTSADATLAYGGTFALPHISVDAYGRVDSSKEVTITLPAQYVHPSADRTDPTNLSSTLAHGGTFYAVTTVNNDTYGHVSAVQKTKYTLPDQYVHPTYPTYTISSDSPSTATKSLSYAQTFDAITGLTADNGHINGFTTTTFTLPAIYVHPSLTRSDTTSAASPLHNGTFTAIDSVTTNAAGHLSSVNVKTITLPEDTHWTHNLKLGTQTLTWNADNLTEEISVATLFKDLGVGKDLNFIGVVSALPTSAVQGDMYKASASFTIPAASNAEDSTASISVKAGDTIIAADSTPTWYHIPSGDDIEDTWRAIKANGTSLLGSGTDTNALDFVNGNMTTVVGSGQTIKVNHNAISNTNLTATSRTYVNGLTFDKYGHLTAYTTGSESVVDTNTWRNVKLQGTELIGTGISTGALDFDFSGATTVAFDTSTSRIKISSTDQSVTAVGYHYIPVGTVTKSASGATAVSGATKQVITGLSLDAAGHVADIVSGAVVDTVYTHPTYPTYTSSSDSPTSASETLTHGQDFSAITGLTADNGHINGFTTTTFTLPDQYVHPSLLRNDTLSSSSVGYGGTITSVDSITSDSTGHLSAINVHTVTLPAETHWSHTLKLGTQTVTWNAADLTKEISVSTLFSDLGIGKDVNFIGVAVTLPASAVQGDMYKIGSATVLPKASNAEYASDNTIADITMKVGDTIIAADSTPTWYYVPSGDDIEDTWRPLSIAGTDQGTNGLSLVTANQNRISITADSGEASFDLASITTGGSYGESASKSVSYGSTIHIPHITVDAYGRTTSASEATITLPASDNTWRSIYVDGTERYTASGFLPLKLLSGSNVTLGFDSTSNELTVSSLDRTVSSAAYHYTPAEDSASELDASGAIVPAVGTTIQVLTGIKRDTKGHITGITSAAIKDTDTVYTHPTITASAVTDDTDTLIYGGTSPKTSFSVVSSVVTNNQGHVTSVHSKSVEIPAEYVHPTYATSPSTPSAVALSHAGTFTAITGITADNGHITGYVNQTYSLPAQYTHPTMTRADTTSSASVGYGKTFTAVDSITSDTTGHVSAINVKTVTLPAETHWSHSINLAGITGTWDSNNKTITISKNDLYTALGLANVNLAFQGVVTAIPTSSEVGFMYKIGASGLSLTADNNAEGTAADLKTGDTLICKTASTTAPVFYMIPSGDDVEDTWRAIQVNGTAVSSLSSAISGSALNLTAGSGVTISDAGSGQITIGHSDTSSASSLTAATRTYVTGMTLDSFGHMTGYTTGTESVVDTNTWRNIKVNGTQILSTAITSGLVNIAGSGASSASWDSSTNTITIASADTKVTSVANHYTGGAYAATESASGATYSKDTLIQVVTGVKHDAAGHITGVTSAAIKDTDTIYTHPTMALSSTTSAATPGYAGTFTAIDSITTDTTGHVSAINTKTLTMPTAYTHPTYTTTATTPAADGTDTSTLAYGGTFDALTALTADNGHLTGYTSSRFKLPAQYVHPTYSTTTANSGTTALDFGGSMTFATGITATNGHTTKITSATVTLPYIGFYSETDADDGLTMTVVEY